MSCYYPLQAYPAGLRANGKRRIVFKIEDAEHPWSKPFNLPCGQCVGCRLERSRQWAIRIMHEASLYASNCYVTLTYREDELHPDRALCLRHWQLFMKRLRRKFGNGIRFFHCGEYSPEKRRPHYHACLFNHDFSDRRYLKMNKSGTFPIFTSEICDALWTHGDCYIGDVSFDSAAYVARYIIDKITGDRAFEHYLDKETGSLRAPEYVTMSRRPGIGADWFNKYMSDVYPSDDVIVKGKQVRPPRFYDSKLESFDAGLFNEMKAKRLIELVDLHENEFQARSRLIVNEKVRLAELSLYKRS